VANSETQQRIDSWKKKIEDLEKKYPQNENEDDVFGKHDMVVNMRKNLDRIEEYAKSLEGKSGAEAIQISNQMEAYFISLNVAEGKMDTNILQTDEAQ
jgi:hypothetical protein